MCVCVGLGRGWWYKSEFDIICHCYEFIKVKTYSAFALCP